MIMRGIIMAEWLDDFLLRAVIAGMIMVAIAAPMGCLMVWQRLAFLSDTLGHAAVMGVGLGLLLQVQPIFGVLAVALLIVFSLNRVTSFRDHARDYFSYRACRWHYPGGLAAGIYSQSRGHTVW